MTNGIITTVPKNRGEHIRVSLTVFKGHNLVDVRVFCERDGGAKPTKAGVSVNVERLPELRAALEKAEAAAQRLGLLKLPSGAS